MARSPTAPPLPDEPERQPPPEDDEGLDGSVDEEDGAVGSGVVENGVVEQSDDPHSLGQGAIPLAPWPAAEPPPAGASLKTWASYYAAELGYSVFPVRGKTPLIPRGYLGATRDLAVIEAWWNRWPDAGIGIPCGAPNGMTVVDIDLRHGGDTLLLAWTQDYGPMPATARVRTGGAAGGGWHLYFASGETSLRLHDKNLRAGGIDVQSTGTFVVAPPSRHAITNKVYRWETDPRILAPLPTWLIALVGLVPEREIEDRALRDTDMPALVNHHRNVWLTSWGGKQLRDGMGKDLLHKHLHEVNQDKCAPPLARAEVDKIFHSLGRYARPLVHGKACTDVGNSERLAGMYGHLLRYVYAWSSGKNWQKAGLAWDFKRWTKNWPDEPGRLAVLCVQAISHEAKEATSREQRDRLLRWCRDSQNGFHLERMLRLLCDLPGISVPPEDLDQAPLLLNCQNGTLDLSGETPLLYPHRKEDLLTKLCPYPYLADAGPPLRWLAFLERFLPQPEMRDWVQQVFGYCLTGLTGEKCFWVLYGSGDNGKGTVLGVLRGLLGTDYAMQAADSLLRRRQAGQATNDIAGLKGMRVVLDSDLPKGLHLNMDFLKKLTGNTDEIVGRHLYADYRAFRPECKLFVATNTKPTISEHTPAVWSRIRLVPFTVTIPPSERILDYDKLLLASEGPAILKWAVDGWVQYQQSGQGTLNRHLPVPEPVQAATKRYRHDADFFGRFLEEACAFDGTTTTQSGLPETRMPISTLVSALRAWAGQNEQRLPVPTRPWLLNELEQRGIPTGIVRGAPTVYGLELLPGVVAAKNGKPGADSVSLSTVFLDGDRSADGTNSGG